MNGIASEKKVSRRVLFVCTGNTCRSPMAEFCFREAVSGMDTAVMSAGLYAFDGEAMSENSLAALKEEGIDGRSFRSQSVTYDLVKESDLIVTMTAGHKAELVMRYPDAAEKCHTLLENSGGDLPDPFGQNLTVYRKTLQIIRQGVLTWKEYLEKQI